MRIGLLSDTHGDLNPRVFHHFKDVDEIWHAGDIGSIEVIDELKAFKPCRFVYGNIDNGVIRRETSESLRFQCEDVEVFMIHIAGKPGKYVKSVEEELVKNGAPKLFICGHSHILLVKMDPRFNMLWLNPGAAGNKGFHAVRTMLRFEINGDKIENLEVIELGPRSEKVKLNK